MPSAVVVAAWVMMGGIPRVSQAADDTPDRPNVVWIMTEDNSKHYLRHFDSDGAPTPRIEAMAAHGVTFDRAFSNAPVCSVARTTLITGCYAPRLGTQFHRKLVPASLPDDLPMFPAELRRAGYHTSNRKKMDYNATASPDVWDESSGKAHWKNRGAGQPFFHVRTITATHESRLHPQTNPENGPLETAADAVVLPPYFPDTPEFRHTRAKYQDLITAVDAKVGAVLDELAADGLLESTFVFYFGDHGGVLPRSKGYVYETGLHVPLVVRVPDAFADTVDRELGSRTKGFVSFIDFGPTVLNLAQAEIPSGMDGKPFLGDGVQVGEVDARDTTIGYADRMDAKYDMNRSIRVRDWKYIRHFEPIFPDSLVNVYRYQMRAYQQWKQLHDAGKLDFTQDAFFRPRTPEALYNLAEDPHETINLADAPEHAGQLRMMRSRLEQELREWPDLSFMTEVYLVDEAMGDPVAYGQDHVAEIQRYIETANLCLQPFDQVEDLLRAALDDTDPLVRYWALVAALSLGDAATPLLPEIERRLLDVEPFICTRAVEYVALFGDKDPRTNLYRSLNRAISEAEALMIIRTAIFLQEHTGGRFPIDMQRSKLDVLKPKKNALSMGYWKYLNSIAKDNPPQSRRQLNPAAVEDPPPPVKTIPGTSGK
ncbi:MAG: sulfatase-like hydrolase/transferase [Planctomycetota bacterium]